jgi:hypothetical protein
MVSKAADLTCLYFSLSLASFQCIFLSLRLSLQVLSHCFSLVWLKNYF